MAQQATTSQLKLSPAVPARVDDAALGTSLNPVVLPMALEQLQVLERLRQLRAWQQQQQDSLLRRQQEQVARLRSEQEGRRRELQGGQARSGRGDGSSAIIDGGAGNSLKGALPLRGSGSVVSAQSSVTRSRSGDEHRPTSIQHSPPRPILEHNSDAGGPHLAPIEDNHSEHTKAPTHGAASISHPVTVEGKPAHSHSESAGSDSPVVVSPAVSLHIAGTPDGSIRGHVAGREADATESDGRDTSREEIGLSSRGRKSDAEVCFLLVYFIVYCSRRSYKLHLRMWVRGQWRKHYGSNMSILLLVYCSHSHMMYFP